MSPLTKLRGAYAILRAEGIRVLVRKTLLDWRNRIPTSFYTQPMQSLPDTLPQWRQTYVHQIPIWLAQNESAGKPQVGTLISTNRPQFLPGLLRTLAAQQGVILQLVIATHGFAPSGENVDLAKRLGLEPFWVQAEASQQLGEVYNQLLSHISAPFVAKIDDDDWYGPYYLLDSVMQLQRAKADIVGKNSHFIYIEKENAVYLRFPQKHHRYTTHVAGATIVARTEVFHKLGFSAKTVGEDRDVLSRAFAAGYKIYSTSPFGFCVRRGADNTWQAEDEHLLRGATRCHTGTPGDFEVLESVD